MKKLIVFSFVLGLFLVSCSSNGDKKSDDATKQESTTTPETTDVTANPDYKAGLALVAKSNCFTCHHISDKLIGPAYQDVAAKYANSPDTIVTHLAHKIIEGGSGVWGEVAMTPHPDVSMADAETMVKYILLLKK
ncbi:MAG TPA: c-type cytochrome [Chitinophagaceae bacterium]|nr:c-type cytochrome [Chitinophagaceae bacterium]HQU56490.1 c-type cytochrome [Chitinophagaceae bacterium]